MRRIIWISLLSNSVQYKYYYRYLYLKRELQPRNYQRSIDFICFSLVGHQLPEPTLEQILQPYVIIDTLLYIRTFIVLEMPIFVAGTPKSQNLSRYGNRRWNTFFLELITGYVLWNSFIVVSFCVYSRGKISSRFNWAKLSNSFKYRTFDNIFLFFQLLYNATIFRNCVLDSMISRLFEYFGF